MAHAVRRVRNKRANKVPLGKNRDSAYAAAVGALNDESMFVAILTLQRRRHHFVVRRYPRQRVHVKQGPIRQWIDRQPEETTLVGARALVVEVPRRASITNLRPVFIEENSQRRGITSVMQTPSPKRARISAPPFSSANRSQARLK